MSSEHHLIGMNSDGSLLHYGISSRPFSKPTFSIWELKKLFPGLITFFELWRQRSKPFDQPCLSNEAQHVLSTLASLDQGKQCSRKDLLKASYFLLGLAPGVSFRRFQHHFQHFSALLTPQYRALVPKVDITLMARDELIFHQLNPEVYLWIPETQKKPEQLLLCFPTKLNSFNMPRSIAHHILGTLGIAILYIGNRPNQDPSQGFLGTGIDSSASLIKQVCSHFGFTKLYALGTSLGGYTASLYAPILGFERVLNFSGIVKLGDNPSIATIIEDYPINNIRSILSRSDPTDLKIEAAYRACNFKSEVSWIDSQTHGTFTASFIEGSLNEHLSWLLSD